FARIDCVRGGNLLEIETIHGQLWRTIEPLLPPKGEADMRKKKRQANQEVTSPVVSKTKSRDEGTPAREQFIGESVTSVNGNVYAFNDRLSPLTIAAAMARLSGRGDDMRITILDEFAAAAGKDEKLLQRVITAYGDDSVQQLVGQHIVVEN